MLQEYQIAYMEKTVGKAKLEKQGRTYLISCVCMDSEANGKTICLNEWKLGKLAFDGYAFTLKKRIACDRLPDKPAFFCEVNTDQTGSIETIFEDRPIQNIDKLTRAKFVIQNGRPAIAIIDQMSISKQTGQ